jgi:RND family efflux transporter MFP subunit
LEANVRAAAAKLANARTEYDRNARLIRTGAVSREEYDLTVTAFRLAQEEHTSALQLLEKGTIAREEDIEGKEAEVRGLEARVVEANIQLQDCTLRAPYDGVIAERFVEQNQNVRAKQRIVKFQDVEEIDIAVDVPETVMAAEIRAADIVQILAEFPAAPGLQFPVHIKEAAQRADPTTQTFNVRVAMKATPDLNLLPGMTASVVVTYRRASILGNRLLVPISAVYKDASGEQVVWIIGPPDRKETDGKVAEVPKDLVAKRRPVKLGMASGSEIEIVDGLQPGDRIAIAGVTHLREGMKVRDLGDAFGGG